MELIEHLSCICKKFRINGNLIKYELITIGNINTTYRVYFDTPKTYILQKVNTYVFKNPEYNMINIDLVTTYIRDKYKERKTLHFHHLENGKNYYQDCEGSFWRLCNDIKSVTYDLCDNLNILYLAGKAYGDFQLQLSDFDASKLYETIPDFHNTKKRIHKFMADVEKDECGRVSECKPEICYIKDVCTKACELVTMLESGELPLRVTHNDTKINNVLFDIETNEPLSVVDLDTVMPGLAMYDFGDAVRSAACTTDEDEKDLSKVQLDLEKYKAFSEGFIGQTAKALTENELKTMPLGAFTIAVELGTRFLNDYITGDKYFKINYGTHNLVRARCQLKLSEDIINKIPVMNDIDNRIIGK